MGYKKRRLSKVGQQKATNKPDTVANILGISDFGST
jgi:hypothetical protein